MSTTHQYNLFINDTYIVLRQLQLAQGHFHIHCKRYSCSLLDGPPYCLPLQYRDQHFSYLHTPIQFPFLGRNDTLQVGLPVRCMLCWRLYSKQQCCFLNWFSTVFLLGGSLKRKININYFNLYGNHFKMKITSKKKIQPFLVFLPPLLGWNDDNKGIWLWNMNYSNRDR